MKLSHVAEMENPWKFKRPENTFEILDPEWDSVGAPSTAKSIRKKMLSLDHQADIMMSKLSNWVKIAKGKVFTSTGIKTGMQLPKQVAVDPRKFLTWTLTHSQSPNIVTKVFVDKDDPKVVLPIRALVNRHNDLTNARADMEGRLAKLNAGKTSGTGPK
jgi:hypothetical protein